MWTMAPSHYSSRIQMEDSRYTNPFCTQHFHYFPRPSECVAVATCAAIIIIVVQCDPVITRWLRSIKCCCEKAGSRQIGVQENYLMASKLQCTFEFAFERVRTIGDYVCCFIHTFTE